MIVRLFSLVLGLCLFGIVVPSFAACPSYDFVLNYAARIGSNAGSGTAIDQYGNSWKWTFPGVSPLNQIAIPLTLTPVTCANTGPILQYWNPVRCATSSITLTPATNPNIATKTANNNTNTSCYGNTTHGASTGSFYWETVTVGSGFTAAGSGVGIGNVSAPINNWCGSTAASLCFYPDGKIWSSSQALYNTTMLWTSGDQVDQVADLTNNKYYVRVKGKYSNYWNNSSTANPATNIGGYAIPAGVLVGGVVPAVTICCTTSPDKVTAHFASTDWTDTVPTGANPW